MAIQQVSNQTSFKGRAVAHGWMDYKKLKKIAKQVNNLKLLQEADVNVFFNNRTLTVQRGNFVANGFNIKLPTVAHPDAIMSATKRGIRQFYREEKAVKSTKVIKVCHIGMGKRVLEATIDFFRGF